MILISQSPSELQLMDASSFKTIEIKKPKHHHYTSEKITFIQIDDKLLLLPPEHN
jgi:NMD protein affecting ribosome stability and mRNA decay